jgi:putative DNA primase/helicase
MSIFKEYNPYTSWEEAFNDACHAINIAPPKEINGDGNIHRFTSSGKSSKSCWYITHIDETQGGVVGNWATGQSQNWHYSKTTLTPIQKQAMLQKWADAAKKAEQQRLDAQQKAISTASQKWDECQAATAEHPYLVKKGVRPYGIKKGKGRIYIPMYDNDGLKSLQSIDDVGNKLFMKDGKVKGCYFILGLPADRLYIAEGYSTAASIYEATGQPVAVVFNAGNIMPAIEELRKKYTGVKLTICADNDIKKDVNSGLIKAKDASLKYGIPLIVPEFTESELKQGNPTDFNDMALLRGLNAVKRVIIPETPTLKFKALTIQDIQRMPPVNWLIDKIFPVNSFCMIYGEPGQKKTFLALDMALSIASNQEWHEREVKAGTVLYIAGEGVGGLNKRIGAWMAHYALDASEIDFMVVPVAVNFISEEDINQLIALIDDTGKQYRAIFIDTVARAILGGDENSSTDMGKFVAGCDAVRNHTGATIIGIHHSGKDDSRGMRGSSSLMGAVDTVLKVEQNEDTKNITVTMKKQKDEEEIQPLTFASKLIEFGIGQSSIILEAIETPENDGSKANTFNAKKRHDLALEYLQDCIANSSEQMFGQPATQLNQWKLECYSRYLGGENQDARRMAFKRAYDRLTMTKQIACKNGVVWIVRRVEG